MLKNVHHQAYPSVEWELTNVRFDGYNPKLGYGHRTFMDSSPQYAMDAYMELFRQHIKKL